MDSSNSSGMDPDLEGIIGRKVQLPGQKPAGGAGGAGSLNPFPRANTELLLSLIDTLMLA